MDLKHTPTPWETSDAFGPAESGTCIKAAADDNMIASCTGYYGRATTIANAEFIVRACNSHDQLVAALWHAEAALSSCYDMTRWPADGTTDQDKALSDVRAALAAAGAA